ncbi:MAG TPA: hypothetical protein VJ770_19150 [Stellaceae bacterium]|nr:hypothetical protein [Stellaceae bacterium]
MRRADRYAGRAAHRPRRRGRLLALFGAVAAAVWATSAAAYTAAGDRTFVATLLLPQVAPADEVYFTGSTLPLTFGGIGSASRMSSASVVYDKTITDRLGVQVEEEYTRLDRFGAPASYGWQNTDAALKYMAINNGSHEFLLTFGVDREFGGTGTRRVGASPSGATTPQIYFGKGLGDLDIGLLRPLAVTGFVGAQAADQRPRPDLFTTGLAVEYSIPYLESKVRSFALPDLVRGMTPITEVLVTAPLGRSYRARTAVLVAPGLVYAGAGWEAGIEAMIPTTRASGRGVGVIAQVHFALDYFFSETLGKPLFGR